MNPFVRNLILMVTFMLVTAIPDQLYACAVCFGDPASPLVQGAKYGVLFLAGVIYVLLFAMLGVVFFWFKRAQALEAEETADLETS